MSVTMLIHVNTADKEELKQIPGVGERVARLLIQFREVYGVIKKEALNLALRGKLPAEALEMIDFSVPKQEDPFDIDLSCLPAVPKTNSWEPLMSFAHQTAARQLSYQVGESFAMSASHYAEQETSPKLAGASSMHASQESRSCRTDSRPVSHCDEEDAKPSVSKTSSSKSANQSSRSSVSEVEKKDRTASGSRSPSSQRHSRTSQGGMGSCRSKSPKAQSSSSRSRSPSSRRHSQKHSPKRTHRRRSKGSSSASRSRSHSSSVSRSRSVKRHSRQTEKKVTKKKKYDSSTSTSRSRSAEHHSRKSDTKVKNKKKQAFSRSDTSSRSVRHSSRKGDSKTRKIKSQRKKDKHSRSRFWSASRSSLRSASRSSQRSLSRSHKRKTKSKGDKLRVNKHKNRLSSRSRSSSRSNSRSSHKKKIKTRRAKSKVHKHKRHSSSCSDSQSRSRSRSRSHRTKTRSKKTKRSHFHSPHSDSDTDSSVDRYIPRHGNPRKHPKALRFDGKTNWLSFKKKFDSYGKVMRWSEEESKDYLMWSLEGKALDFLTITKTDLEKYSFRKIMKKLETRFGVKELTETSKAKFRQAFQKQDESLEEWADRVMTLATPAFVDLPENHLKKEAIARFRQGCTDKEAAKHACFEQPETMEEALNLVKHHQYISQAVDGKKGKREYEASVNAVQSPSVARVEQLIRSALRDFAAKLQESSTSLSSSSETEEKTKKKKSSSQCSFVRNLDILRKIAESIKHGLAKSKIAGQKTQRAIPAKNSKED